MAMEDQRHPKRPKICRGDDDYMPGNIIKIELFNFMTFDKLTCKPSSRLNLVIGPNGSGKSSLVCAIALGLGGEPQLLGRATSVGAYVKRGEESGYINICLRGEKKETPISITRKIDTRNKSEWLLNGKSVAKKEIQEVIQRFNIQVNNLTQFLPQDRVCEFAKLTPVQLLEETEKAVGDPQLPVLHHSLITKSQELKKFERSVESNKGTLDQLMAQNAELEKDVERVRQREDYLAKAESMKKKLPWLKYDMKKAEYLEAKEQEKEALLKVTEAADAAKELNKPIEVKKKEKAELDGECKKVKGLLDGNMKKRLQLVEDDSRLVVLIKGKYNEVDELRSQEETRQHRISKAKENLAAAEVELSNLPTYERPVQKMEQLKAQIMELDEAAREMRSQKSEKEKQLNQHRMMLNQCMNRLKEMADAKNKRLSALKNNGADKIFQAYEWVNQHRHEFKGETYGPLLLEVNVSDQFHADCLEGQVPSYLWKTFLVEDSRDRDFLFHGLQHFNVPISKFSKDINGRRIKHFHATNEMKALMISARLDQVFEAPDLVTEFLIDHCNLDNAYIGSKETDNKADQALKVGIMNLWTPDNHYQWSKSRYGNHVSGNVNAVQQSRLLRCNVDTGEIEKQELRKAELEEKISIAEASLKDLQVTIRQNENDTGKLHREREDLVNMADIKRKQLKDAENLVSKRRKILESMEKDDDSDTTIAKLMDEAKKLKMRRFQCALKIKDLLVEAVGHRRKSAEVNFCSYELEVKIKEMEFSAKEQQDLVQQTDDKYKQCKAEVVKFRERLAASKSHAESIAVLTPELKKAFEEMPTTVEDLEDAIQDIISEANSILFLNANILGEYESRQKKIEELKEKKESGEKELHDRVQEISDLKEHWLPTLRGLVIRINETFSRNFQEMAVAGEVSLDEHDMDFDHYGILIKVKFRQTGQLQVLSAHHQSGGERSVSTILYLVSLQDLTNCPFRVVDEINQGMDPINERKMFQQLVRAASQLNTPQCFLLTPKLLPNLEYTEACCVLNVMNGPWIEAPSKVWSCGESWGSVFVQMDEDRS